MSCPTLKSIMKNRRQPSITAIHDAYKRSSFPFSTVEKVDVITEIKKLSKKKILKENFNFFAEWICIFYNHVRTTSKFPSFLKMANITPIWKKGSKNKKKIFEKLKKKQ